MTESRDAKVNSALHPLIVGSNWWPVPPLAPPNHSQADGGGASITTFPGEEKDGGDRKWKYHIRNTFDVESQGRPNVSTKLSLKQCAQAEKHGQCVELTPYSVIQTDS